MTEEFCQRRSQLLGQFVMRCQEVNNRPQWQKDHVQQHKGNFGDSSSINPILVKVLI